MIIEELSLGNIDSGLDLVVNYVPIEEETLDLDINHLIDDIKSKIDNLLAPETENLENRLLLYIQILKGIDQRLNNRSRRFLDITPIRHIEDGHGDELRQARADNWRGKFVAKYFEQIIQHAAETYFHFRNYLQDNIEAREIAKPIINENLEFLYATFATKGNVQLDFKEIDKFAMAVSPDKQAFQERRIENRHKVSEYLFSLEGPLTIEQIAECFRLLTENLFFGEHSYFRTKMKNEVSIGGTGTRSSVCIEDMQNLCDEYNALLFGNIGGIEYYNRFINLFIKFIDTHPFIDWNGTIIMMLMRALTSRKKQSRNIEDYQFIANNDDMVKAIFNNNLPAMALFAQKMVKQKFLIKDFFKLRSKKTIVDKLP